MDTKQGKRHFLSEKKQKMKMRYGKIAEKFKKGRRTLKHKE